MSPSLIQPNLACRIRSLDENSSARLAQMGILPGVEMQIVRTSPFGSGTVEVMVGGADIVAIRSDEIAAMDCDLVAVPLSSPIIEPGVYRVASIAGGSGLRSKMSDLGIVEHATIEILRASPLHIAVNGDEVRLGRGEADKVVVEAHGGS